MKIALCFSGHFRNFNYSVGNIKSFIIRPLLSNNHHVDIFCSFWDTNGFREESFGNNITDINIIKTIIDPKILDFEKFNANSFNQYRSDQYLEYPNLCCINTSYDASSMWYKVNRCFQLMNQYSIENNIKYDIIFRLRPDIIYTKPIDINIILNAKYDNKLYMPIWHKKYENVTCQMMDHFSFGNYQTMSIYMNTYNVINNVITQKNYPHTAEGFLYYNLKLNNIIIERFNINYSVIRPNNIELVI